MIGFILNNERIETDLPQGMVLADFIRYKQCLTGTKLGCREGDCGACTVLVGSFNNNKLTYESVTSCLMPLGNAQGKHIVTVEGVNTEGLNFVQQALTDEGGTQCGFCTPGFIVSLCGFALSENKHDRSEGVLAVAGNICRCTGYKSIERAIGRIVDKLTHKNPEDSLNWLVKNNFLPAYFLDIKYRMPVFQKNGEEQISADSDSVFVGGGTDLYVQRPEEMFKSKIVHTLNRTDLKGIWKASGKCHIGASASTEEMKQSDIIQSLSPDSNDFFDLISSLQIRNMATVAGNLVNASPIGDISIFLLALDAGIVLNANGSLRSIPLHTFFIDYKKLDKKADEFVQEVNFNLPSSGFLFNFEKVCKRTYLDIASVNSAASVTLNNKGEITQAAFSAGGVAPVPKYLPKTSAFMIGKIPTAEMIVQTLDIAQSEVAPIADVRGSVQYKRLLLRQLMTGHFMKFFPELY
jgi:xanthine dehydrogenase small subunit